MANNPKIRLDRAGVGAILKSPEIAAMCTAEAEHVQALLDPDIVSYVNPYTTDRKAASVAVEAEAQARDGALTRAAAAVGLEVFTR